VSRDNLDENGGGDQSVKRRPVARVWSSWVRSFASIFLSMLLF